METNEQREPPKSRTELQDTCTYMDQLVNVGVVQIFWVKAVESWVI